MGGVGRGSGKLILFGEHAAVYGYPAVGLPLAEQTVVELSGGGRESWDLSAVPAKDRDTVGGILERLEDNHPDLAAFIQAWGRAAVRVTSEVPRGVGFGSSAALAAAFAAAALAHAAPGTTVGLNGVWSLAHDAERLFHGTPSGIDTGLAIFGGLRSFSPSPPGLPESEPLQGMPLYLVVAAIPRAGDCGSLVAALGERMRSGDPRVRAELEALGRLAAEARDELARPREEGPSRLGLKARSAMDHLRALGLSTDGLDALLAEGDRAGALGGKLSGAGGGGAFFLIMPDADSAGEAILRLGRAAEASGISFAAPPRLLRAGPSA
jgi:mevalonate kinase